jgi:hypothetical protein
MATSRSPWKGRERQAAALFGARRQVLSGSAGRSDRPASDSTHERNFLEIKLRKIHAVRTLLDAVRDSARHEGKIPVLGLASKDRAGLLLVVDSLDRPRLVTEFAAADSDLASGREDRSPFSGARKEA